MEIPSRTDCAPWESPAGDIHSTRICKLGNLHRISHAPKEQADVDPFKASQTVLIDHVSILGHLAHDKGLEHLFAHNLCSHKNVNGSIRATSLCTLKDKPPASVSQHFSNEDSRTILT